MTHKRINFFGIFFFFLKIQAHTLMRETQEYFYLVLFMFASQLYFYVLGPSSLLSY